MFFNKKKTVQWMMRNFLALSILLICQNACAAPTTLTNDSDSTVKIQYETTDSKVKDFVIKPNEIMQLPSGVEKIKLIKDSTAVEKNNPEINVIVQTGDQILGTLSRYGDRLFFDKPTDLPIHNYIVGADEKQNSGNDNLSEQIPPSAHPEKVFQTKPGAITNNGAASVLIQMGTVKEDVVAPGELLQIPLGTEKILLRKNGNQKLPQAADLAEINLDITHPDGSVTHLDVLPDRGIEVTIRNEGGPIVLDQDAQTTTKSTQN